MTKEEFAQHQAEQQRQEALARQHAEDLNVALGTLRNATGIPREELVGGLQQKGTRLVKVKGAGLDEVNGHMLRVTGRPDAFVLLSKGEELPSGIEALEEVSLRDHVADAVAQRGAARRIAGASAMGGMSVQAAQAEQQATENDQRTELRALEARLGDVVCQELKHALDEDGLALARGAFRKAAQGDDSMLDEVLLTRTFVKHPGGGEAPAYRLRQWTAEGAAAAEAPLSLEDSEDGSYRVRTLRQLAKGAYDKHAAVLRYGERALVGLPGYSGRLF